MEFESYPLRCVVPNVKNGLDIRIDYNVETYNDFSFINGKTVDHTLDESIGYFSVAFSGKAGEIREFFPVGVPMTDEWNPNYLNHGASQTLLFWLAHIGMSNGVENYSINTPLLNNYYVLRKYFADRVTIMREVERPRSYPIDDLYLSPVRIYDGRVLGAIEVRDCQTYMPIAKTFFLKDPGEGINDYYVFDSESRPSLFNWMLRFVPDFLHWRLGERSEVPELKPGNHVQIDEKAFISHNGNVIGFAGQPVMQHTVILDGKPKIPTEVKKELKADLINVGGLEVLVN